MLSTETNPVRAHMTELTKHFFRGELTKYAPDFCCDSATRMFPVEVLVENTNHQIVSGLTAEVMLTFEQNKAHFITPAILALKEDGTVGVKIINEQNRAEFYPVDILSHTENGMWVKGIPEKIRLITVGQEYVTVGQKVDPLKDEEKLEAVE